jgi:hypothetical protein
MRKRQPVDVKTFKREFRRTFNKRKQPGFDAWETRQAKLKRWFFKRSFHHFPVMGQAMAKFYLKLDKARKRLPGHDKLTALPEVKDRLVAEMLPQMRRKLVKSGQAKTVKGADALILKAFQRYRRESDALNEALIKARFQDERVVASKKLIDEMSNLQHLYNGFNMSIEKVMEDIEAAMKKESR